MRVCVVYDCLFPYTVGGAERWYGNLAGRLVAAGHEVTYLTLRQWPRGETPQPEGVRVVAVGPRMGLYAGSGRRRILPPVVFGAGVLVHLLRERRSYDVVHTASFPYFSLLAAGLARPLARFRLFVDWHEVWTAGYWREYLGAVGGRIGEAVQRLCLRVPQRAFCFSRLHARRLEEHRVRGPVTILGGEYAGEKEASEPRDPEPVALFAGRLIPEKGATDLVPALALARERIPGLGGEIYGDGPLRAEVLGLIESHGLADAVRAPGFVAAETLEERLRLALCMVLPSRREGYGMVVIEAAAAGTPSVVVRHPDNAATELVEEGVNGFVAPSSAPEDLAGAILRVHESGFALRATTAEWFSRNVDRLSIDSSMDLVAATYSESARR